MSGGEPEPHQSRGEQTQGSQQQTQLLHGEYLGAYAGEWRIQTNMIIIFYQHNYLYNIYIFYFFIYIIVYNISGLMQATEEYCYLQY